MPRGSDYERHKEDMRRRQQARTRLGQDIASRVHECRNPKRKESCRRDFMAFARTYCYTSEGPVFSLPFSEDHRKVVANIETAILYGGMYALAMPRAQGKSSICVAACCWAVLYGHRRFVLLVGATAGHAQEMLGNVKGILEQSDQLWEDFPEVCCPVRELDGETKKQGGQRWDDIKTDIHWGNDYVDLPYAPAEFPSDAAGATIRYTGITGRLRGFNIGGKRPDLVIFDDPQTDTSSASDSQNAKRERVLARSVIGLAGPGKTIAAIMPCTVIHPGDMADRILSHELHPEWQSSRTKLLYEFPTKREMWDRYKTVRTGYDPDKEGDKVRAETEATCFYVDHQSEMDAGAVVAWPERFLEGEVSAVQYAMNLFLQNEYAFWSEYQNEPKPLITPSAADLDADEVAARLNHLPRGTVPAWTQRLTVGIDVQKDLLYYCLCAWGEGFSGAVVDYGAWPEQRRDYYTLSDARPTISVATGVGSPEGSLWSALTALTAQILGRAWQTESGSTLHVDRCLVDSGSDWSVLVKRFCRESAHAGVLLPSKGASIGAQTKPMSEWQRKPGERRGPSGDWIVTPPRIGEGRLLLFDPNLWKSFLSARLKQPLGEPGALTLFGSESRTHRMFADHLTSEYAVLVFGQGRELNVWKKHLNRDNHLFDAAILACVAASERGAAPPGMPAVPERRREKKTFASLQAKANGG